MTNLSRSCPTKWKMSKALRGEGLTRKLHKVRRVTWWHHKWVLTMIKETPSTEETTGTEEGSKQRQSQLDNYCSSVISSKLITEILQASELLWLVAQRCDWRGSFHLQAEIRCSSSHVWHAEPATKWFHLNPAHAACWWGSQQGNVRYGPSFPAGIPKVTWSIQWKELALLPAEITSTLPSKPMQKDRLHTVTFTRAIPLIKMRHYLQLHESHKTLTLTFSVQTGILCFMQNTSLS